ncbi:hypothetical protein JZU46_06565 [bacterium]|nr:hypothetical protein [bacterium]
MEDIIILYEEGLCPDCFRTIDLDMIDGGSCSNCGHVFIINDCPNEE